MGSNSRRLSCTGSLSRLARDFDGGSALHVTPALPRPFWRGRRAGFRAIVLLENCRKVGEQPKIRSWLDSRVATHVSRSEAATSSREDCDEHAAVTVSEPHPGPRHVRGRR